MSAEKSGEHSFQEMAEHLEYLCPQVRPVVVTRSLIVVNSRNVLFDPSNLMSNDGAAVGMIQAAQKNFLDHNSRCGYCKHVFDSLDKKKLVHEWACDAISKTLSLAKAVVCCSSCATLMDLHKIISDMTASKQSKILKLADHFALLNGREVEGLAAVNYLEEAFSVAYGMSVLMNYMNPTLDVLPTAVLTLYKDNTRDTVKRKTNQTQKKSSKKQKSPKV